MMEQEEAPSFAKFIISISIVFAVGAILLDGLASGVSSQFRAIDTTTTYSYNSNLELSPGIILSDCDNISNWSTGGSGTVELGGTYTLDGGSIKMIATNDLYITTEISHNFSTDENIYIWYYTENCSDVDYIFTWFESDAGYMYKYIFPTRNGWNPTIFSLSDFGSYGGETWNTSKTTFGFEAVAVDDECTIYLDEVGYNYNQAGKGTIFLTFDDGRDSVYDLAYPIMESYNLTGTSYVITDRVGTSQYMTLEQLKELQAAGWNIGSHSQSHVYLTTLNDSELDAQLKNSQSWLLANGFGKGAYTFAIPFGSYDSNVLQHMAQYYVLGRSSDMSYCEPYPQIDIYSHGDSQELTLRSFYATASTYNDTDRFNASIDSAAETNGMLVLMFHQFTENESAAEEYIMYTGDFEKICQYIESKGSAVQVLPMSEMIDTTVVDSTGGTAMSGLYTSITSIVSDGYTIATLSITSLAAAAILRMLGYL